MARIRDTPPAPLDGVNATPSKRDAPRVPFGALVETGLVLPGAQLYDRQRKVSVSVAADGSLLWGRQRGSIHQIGAAVQNAPSCNGWSFWHIFRDGKLVPIDALRNEYALLQGGAA